MQDNYSMPQRIEKTKLAELFFLSSRRTEAKSDREMVVAYDSLFPLVDGFVNHYLYYVRFDHRDVFSGNHYHKKKTTFFIPVYGAFELKLKGILDDSEESLEIKAKDNVAVLIKPDIAHKIIAKTDDAVMLEIASCRNDKTDSYPFLIE